MSENETGYRNETMKGLLQHHEPESWRFYRYGTDDEGEPLFSFWMNISDDTGVCIFERNQGAGKWLSTEHAPEEYEGVAPSDELKAVLRDIIADGIDGERLEELPDYERYFFQVVHGTIEQKGKAPVELLRFLSQITGTKVRIE